MAGSISPAPIPPCSPPLPSGLNHWPAAHVFKSSHTTGLPPPHSGSGPASLGAPLLQAHCLPHTPRHLLPLSQLSAIVFCLPEPSPIYSLGSRLSSVRLLKTCPHRQPSKNVMLRARRLIQKSTFLRSPRRSTTPLWWRKVRTAVVSGGGVRRPEGGLKELSRVTRMSTLREGFGGHSGLLLPKLTECYT